MPNQTFQLLQISDVLDMEFASALAEQVPVIAWEPLRTWVPFRVCPGTEQERTHPGSSLRLRSLPLLRGYARPPVSWFAHTGRVLTERLRLQVSDPQDCPLICTTPYFAPVAERWPGPVIYWLTDLIAMYSSADRRQVEALDRRMCRAATLVCPNSRRIRNYLIERAGCRSDKIEIVPNATRAANLLPHPPRAEDSPQTFYPIALQSIPSLAAGPVAGVIGNLAGNMDWLFLKAVISATPWLSWVFVGPTSMDILDIAQRDARVQVQSMDRAHFVGRQPYGDLAAFARSFDVAILPYRRCEPTYSGSSTRFYEHLAACRPMVATRGLEELNQKTEFLRLVDNADDAVVALNNLKATSFDDGGFDRRWQESLQSSWQARATSVRAALARRLQ